jgi:hypothetical protein
VRRFSSADRPEAIDPNDLDVPTYWIRPPQELSTTGGMHRFVWDLHYPSPPGPRDLPIAAVDHDTPIELRGPWVVPGEYTIRLTALGKSYEQPLTVKMDPRVKTSADDLATQLELSLQCCDGLREVDKALQEVATIRRQLKELLGQVKDKALKAALADLDKKAGIVEGTIPDDEEDSEVLHKGHGLRRLEGELARLLAVLQEADAEPTPQAVAACSDKLKTQKDLLKTWHEFTDTKLKEMNERLRKADLPPLDLTTR